MSEVCLWLDEPSGDELVLRSVIDILGSDFGVYVDILEDYLEDISRAMVSMAVTVASMNVYEDVISNLPTASPDDDTPSIMLARFILKECERLGVRISLITSIDLILTHNASGISIRLPNQSG